MHDFHEFLLQKLTYLEGLHPLDDPSHIFSDKRETRPFRNNSYDNYDSSRSMSRPSASAAVSPTMSRSMMGDEETNTGVASGTQPISRQDITAILQRLDRIEKLLAPRGPQTPQS